MSMTRVSAVSRLAAATQISQAGKNEPRISTDGEWEQPARGKAERQSSNLYFADGLFLLPLIVKA